MSEVFKANRTHCSFSTADESAGSVEGDRGKRDPGIDTESRRLRDRESWGLGESREQLEGESSTLLHSTEMNDTSQEIQLAFFRRRDNYLDAFSS